MSDSGSYDIFAKIQGIVRGMETFADILYKAHDWYQHNAENISKYVLAFADFGVWSVATDKLIENQFVFTDNLTSELANEIYNGADIKEVVSRHYFENDEGRMKTLIHRCQQSEQVQKYGELYKQIICAYDMEHYLIACIGLFALVDGVLADASGIISTGFQKRLDQIKDKFADKVELNEIDRKTLYVYQAFGEFDSSVFRDSNFHEEEPQEVNRHWDLHGRTHREHTKIDFLKVLLWLDAIIFLAGKDVQ